MPLIPNLVLAMIALGLSACVRATPLDLSDDNPDSPSAASGIVDAPTALSTYKSADAFAARAGTSTTAPSGEMQGMPGMQHGGAPHSAGDR